MITKTITIDQYDHIDTMVDKFNEDTENLHNLETGDVLYSFFKSDDENFHILNDWDEGESNDPFWNKEFNMHSCCYFILKCCEYLGCDIYKWY